MIWLQTVIFTPELKKLAWNKKREKKKKKKGFVHAEIHSF